ncbi:MAG: translation initiation factor IF-2 [Lachnospiraceae bacterium]|nr:translation initiation factor IF-2 [Lachnospiraceae bacterium]
MAKMRVNELAKELAVPNKDILTLLHQNGFDAVKSHSSNIEDDAINLVRSHFGKSAGEQPAPAQPKAEAKPAPAAAAVPDAAVKQEIAESKPAETPAQSAPVQHKETPAPAKPAPAAGKEAPSAKEGEAGEKRAKRPRPKKKNITTVFNMKYSSQQGGGSGRSNDARRRERSRSRQQEHDPQRRGGVRGIIRPRPESERTVRPKATQPRPDEEEIIIRPAQEKTVNEPKKKPAALQNTNAAPQQDTKQAPAKNSNDRPKNEERRAPRPENQARGGQQPQASSNGSNANKSQQGNKPGGKDSGKNRRKKKGDALGKKKERYVNLEKKERNKRSKNQNKQPQERNSEEILTLILPERLTIKELADKIQVAPSAIVKKLFMKGTMVTVNQSIEYEQAEEIALEFNCICEPEEKVDVIAELLKEEEEDPTTMVTRPPVVCVMGHVDHGKTSLLDAIRDTRVTAREAGGITQKIGAYVVSVNDQNITFLDTPGHEAFTAMRMRGANSTDIAILVVAADDGVMPQTVEAINHAKAADIEIIVAINKIDKPNANIERVKQELSEYELIPTDWGGSTEFVPVSAHTHEGIDDLLEMILLTSEVLELKSNPKRNARGLVIEAELDKGRGAVATVLVQKGTLKVGDPVAAGSSFGRVRAMVNDNGENVKTAGPSVPVEIFGLSEVPRAGEIFVSLDSEKEARSFAETFINENKNRMVEESRMKMSLDDLFSQIQAGNLKELDIIVKADVQGSVEAVRQSLEKLSNDEVVVKVIHGGVGAITESDVTLASASNAIIIGFNVRPDPVAKQTADQEGVDVRLYKVIYNAIEDVEAAMKGMLEPVYEEKVIGHAEVRQIFKSSDVGNIAGSYVLDGMFQRDCKIRITRGEEQIYEGSLSSLKRFKDDVKEVKAGYECGLVFAGFDAMVEEDQIEAYIMVEVPRDRL